MNAISTNFKSCPRCDTSWPDRRSFLEDTDLTYVGYQINPADLDKGLFLFNHVCKSTIGVPVSRFYDLYDGEVWTTNMMGTEACPLYCLVRDEVEICPNQCNCNHVRQIIRLLVTKMNPKDA